MRSWILCVALVLSCKPGDGKDDELFALCDDDGDGFVEAECAQADPDGLYDCDDVDPNAFPGATEACNGVDDDCDGTIDNGPVAVFSDVDGDGYGNDDVESMKCGVYEGFTDKGGDCNDDDAAIHPGATEVCNGVDDDCTGNEQDATDATTWYRDFDADLHGDAETPLDACAMPAGYVALDDDCDDHDPGANPDAPEVCDTIDNDCDTLVDDDDPDSLGDTTWYADTDLDGHGDPATSVIGCSPGAGWSAVADDCDDQNFDAHPGAIEVCDDADNDCEGTIDLDATDMLTWYLDADHDLHGTSTTVTVACAAPASYVASSDDCADLDPGVYPGATEVCDSIDTDCDGTVDDGVQTKFYADSDKDGHGTPTGWTMACAAPPDFVADSIDCDDRNFQTYTGAPEVCDLKDNDCDTLIDDGAVNPGTYFRDADADGSGNPTLPVQACGAPAGYVQNSGDCNDANANVEPGIPEVCNNGIDDNCDTFGCEPRGAISFPSASAYWVVKGEGAGDHAGSRFVGADVDVDAANDDDLIIGAWGSGGMVPAPPSTYIGGAVYSVTAPVQNTLLSTITREISEDSLNQRLPLALSACDLNRDGKRDVVVSTDQPGTFNGTWRVRIFESPGATTTNMGGAMITFLRTGGDSDQGGAALACGDQNGDSMDDLFIGAPKFGASDDGALWIVRGRATGYAANHDLASAASGHYTITAGAAGDALGAGVAVGDMSGDGRDDVAVGATGADGGGSNAGAIYVFTDSTFPGNLTKSVATAAATFRGEVAGDQLGTTLTAGDFNGDGKADIAAIAGGDLYVIYGRATWSAPAVGIATANLIRRSSSGTPMFVGDLNNDGFDDLTIANGSTVFLWYGGASVNLSSAPPDATITLASSATNGRVGDINGDGYDDLFVGSPYDDATGTDAGALFGLRGAGR